MSDNIMFVISCILFFAGSGVVTALIMVILHALGLFVREEDESAVFFVVAVQCCVLLFFGFILFL